MKTNSIMKKILSYLKELTIVTIGVLVALVISNYKDNSEARKYELASFETIKTEIDSNYCDLKDIFDGHRSLLDTINTYSGDRLTIYDLFKKVDGLHIATLSNTGLEFYSKNQIESIDFGIMSLLMGINSLSELIGFKVDKLMDYAMTNIFDDSEECIMMLRMHLRNVMESEFQLLQNYEYFISEYMEEDEDKE